MASRTILHHAALKITPPPRTLRESREVYRSLRKFGEIDLYRSLRHETSTLEAKEDAIVLFRDEAALRDAFEASPMNVSMPASQPSPIPSSGHSIIPTNSIHPFSDKFTIEISRREHNHETRIIDQLFTYTQASYSITQETPPGTSISFNSKSDIGRVPDTGEYRTNLARATGGGWKSWRLEMKQAGIPTWDSIKPTSDIVTTAPLESSSPRSRVNSASWGRPLDIPDSGKQDAVQPIPPKSTSSTISNPTPLPLDPTLQPFRRQRPPQIERTNTSLRGSTGWWRSASQVEGRSFQPPSQQPQPGTLPIAESVNRNPSRQTALNDENIAPISTGSKGSTATTENIVEMGPSSTLSDADSSPVVEPKRNAETKFEGIPESTPEHGVLEIHEIKGSQQEDTAMPFVRDVPSRANGRLEGQAPIEEKTPIDDQVDEATPIKGVQSEQKRTSESQPVDAIPESEPVPAKKSWWRLPWQR